MSERIYVVILMVSVICCIYKTVVILLSDCLTKSYLNEKEFNITYFNVCDKH